MDLRLAIFLSLLAACGGTKSGDIANSSTAGTGAVPSAPAGTGSPPLAGSGAAGTSSSSAAGTSSSSAAGSSSSAAAGSSSTDSAIPATFATVKLVLGGGGGIMPCAAAPCHGVHGMAPPGRPLELPPNDDQQLYTNLTSYVSKACGDRTLVTPGNPAQSALLAILTGPCGATPRMPFGCSADAGDCIPDEYIAAVRQWIERGAPRP